MQKSNPASEIGPGAISNQLHTHTSDLLSPSHANTLQLFRDLSSEGRFLSRKVYFSPNRLTENSPASYKKSNSLLSPLYDN